MTTPRTIALVLVPSLLLGLVAGCAPSTAWRAASDGSVDARPVDHDAELVLDLVVRHRGQADDARRRQIAHAVVGESRAAGADPLLVAAIVAHESSFRPRAVSRAGAVGLMQLRPFVARDVAARSGVAWQGRDTLSDPALNVRLGIRYLDEMLLGFDGDPAAALTAYNAGPTRLRARIGRGGPAGSAYAERVLATYARLEAARDTRRIAGRDALPRS